MSEPCDPSELVEKVRLFCDELQPHAEALGAIGVDVPAFVADSEKFIAKLELRGDPKFDLNGFIRRLNAFAAEAVPVVQLFNQAERIRVGAGGDGR